jgi:acetoin utilization deacetylase AcuC-like enzyme
MQQTGTALSGKLTAIPVFYSEDLLADASSFSPSAMKPRYVLEALRAAGLALDVRHFAAVEPRDFELAHDPSYVQGVLCGSLANGFGNRREAVARSLPYTTGALVAAARAALSTGCACAPVSGFHHARYDTGGGFCTFNGLIVAARKLIAETRVRRVLILDCDMHEGDGTDQIIATLSLAPGVENCTFGRWFDAPTDAPAYLAKLRVAAARFHEFDLILYQAGADVHIDDPLGGVLTTAQMRERDRLVFERARSAGVPIAWNLAGGYQEPLSRVVALHVNTMQECTRIYCGNDTPASQPARSER